MLSLSRTWIGVVVAVAGNVTISLALNCQKLAHTRLQKSHQESQSQDDNHNNSSSEDAVAKPHQPNSHETQSNGHAGEDQQVSNSRSSGGNNNNGMDTEFLHSKLWWLGLALMTIGEAGNFISYGFAPASLVAPLGAVALLSNVIISPILLRERFRPSDIGGILLAIIGAVTVVFSSKQNDVRVGPSQLLLAIKRLEFLIYTAISVSSGALLAFLSTTSLGDSWVLIDVGTCAIFGGFTVLSTKGISSLISGGKPIEALKFPITYGLLLVLAATAVVQITYLNRALQRFDSREVIPTQFVFFTISAIVGSAILYRDFENMDAHRLINFLFGCLTTFAGVFVLTWRRGESGEGLDQHALAEEGEAEEEEDVEEETEVEEEEPLLSHSWHGIEPSTKPRPRHLKALFEQSPSSALRVPPSQPSSSRPRSRTNSPHKATSRLSGSFDRPCSTHLSRSASNQPNAGLLSNSGQRTPKLSLMSMDRPTGLSPGHYLLLATPPPNFTLNPVAPVQSTSAQRSALSRGMQPQYGAVGNKSGPSAFLPFPVTMAPGPGRRGQGIQQAIGSVGGSMVGGADGEGAEGEGEVIAATSSATAAETILTPVAETNGVGASREELPNRLVQQMTPSRSSSTFASGSNAAPP
ncbi:hypothetical protein NDA14_005087 [Ustilago hordei]|uniref:DUF803 domain membrane protein n=1 Tax=Ustilago hordei TaxID=120017 RepID=I2FXY2_USTHO|nr:uncharacterized protein UHO2_00262 [Ustilago hordei]KAJ1041257.1 hypothetical protein NDA10_006805 [Ustilago hordei]KAJ1602408.1 hypothetical protein NDA14_005087 [Ustilago hordei]UTT96804.1 hypothetical protein NDA17_006235 [Ustilago hordei]CCF51775.1 uncharacterized protein UHOR_03790 [Ustilago hordei]SYW81757.1 uncharacterized protein UHO2_00262 [Ustilago hordei]